MCTHSLGNLLTGQSVNRDPEAANSRKDRLSTAVKDIVLKSSMDLFKIFPTSPLKDAGLINTPVRTDALLPGSNAVTLVLFTLALAKFLKVNQQRFGNSRLKQLTKLGTPDARGRVKHGAEHLGGGRKKSKVTLRKLTS